MHIKLYTGLIVSTLLHVTVGLCAPSMQGVQDALIKSKFTFSPTVRKAYMDYNTAVCKDAVKGQINAETWSWLKQNPQILSAAYAAETPVNPRILVNFQRLALPFEKTKVRNWSQLILAYAIRYAHTDLEIDRLEGDWNPEQLMRLVAQYGDYAFQSDSDLPKLTDEEQSLVKWLTGPQNLTDKRPKFKIADLMDVSVHEINIMAEHKIKLTKFPNWENVALAGKIFPLYVDGTPTHQRSLASVIWRWERHPFPRKAEFDPYRSEWPILLYLTDLDHLDETLFLWDYFVEKRQMAPIGLGQMIYKGRPIDLKERGDPTTRRLYYNPSKWHPDKLLRKYNSRTFKKDEGGKQVTLGKRSICVPSSMLESPEGHMYWTGSKGFYGVYFISAVQEDVATITNLIGRIETADPQYPLTAKSNSMIFEYEAIGLAATLSQGVSSYENVRLALGICREMKDLSASHKITFLESVFMKSPLNSDLIYTLANLYQQENRRADLIRMLVAVRAYFAEVNTGKPLTRAVINNGVSAVKKVFAARVTVSATNAPKIPISSLGKQYSDSFGWIHHVCTEAVLFNFREIPTNPEAKAESLAFLEAEKAYLLACCGEGGTASPIGRRNKEVNDLINTYR